MKYITVATAYIAKDEKILLIRRSSHNKHFTGAWQLPEGKIEAGEAPLAALEREINEELRRSITSAVPIGPVSTTITLAGEEITVERSVFRVSLDNASIQLSDEHDQFAWFEPESLKALELYPGTLSVIMSAALL